VIKDEVKQETAEEQKTSQEEAGAPETEAPKTEMPEADAAEAEKTAKGDGNSEDAAEGKDADAEGADEKDPETAQKKGLFGKKKKTEETVSKSAYDDLNNQYLRLNADFQNFRRRNENTRSEAYADAKASLITDLLGVLDNFDRALANPTEDTKYAEGVELIHKTFLEVVTKAGLTEIEAEGKPFDPNLHNAVMKQPKEGVESDTVITVFQKGYMLGGKVLRPSMVIVAE